MSQRPVRVLHTIDGLGAGGSERWVWDLVRLSDATRVIHRVVPIHPDRGRFVYADRLRARGVLPGEPPPALPHRGEPRGPRRRLTDLPAFLQPGLIGLWHAAVVFPMAAGRLAVEYRRFRPDVVHAHTFHGLVAGLLLRALSHRPLAYTVPSFFRHIEDSGYAWVPWLYARHHSRIDRFITSYPSELRGIGVPDEKILAFRGMADVASMAPLRARRDDFRRHVRSQLGLDPGAFLAISVGRLAPEKGLAYGIQALPAVLTAHRDFHWAVLGSGPGQAELETLAAELGVGAHVHFVGFVSDPLPWYAAADLYLRTNVLEGDNLSSFQAMAAGLPVVGFDTRSETELIPEARHGVLVENRNPAALGDALRGLIAAPDREQVGQRGATFAAAHLTTEHVVRSCEAAYRELAGSRPLRSQERRLDVSGR